MLKQRIFTGLILAVIAIWVVLQLPSAGFAVVLLALVVLGAWEWARLAGFVGTRDRLWYSGAVLGLVLACWPLMSNSAAVTSCIFIATAGWCWALVWLWRYSDHPDHLDRTGVVAAAGLVVLVALWVALVALRDGYGPRYVLFLLLLVWVADSGAYFSGRRWGRRKVAPTISPGKTWEGVLGGALATLILALVGASVLHIAGSRWLWFAVLCMITMGFSVVGDLFESMMKRQRGLKDSGSLLPGHGGVLDRVDSLSAAAPIFLLGLYGIDG